MTHAIRSFLARRASRAAAASGEALPGLEVFGSELPVDRLAGGWRAGGWPRMVTPLLAGLVAVQLVPTTLWIRNVTSSAGTTPAVTTPVEPPHGLEKPAQPVASSPEDASKDKTAPTTGARAASAPMARAVATPAAPARREPRHVPPAAAGPTPIHAGLLAVEAPVPMQVRQRGRLVGTSEAETIMLPLGTHELEFASEAVGYRVSQTVTIQAGRTTRVQIPGRSGRLHINALPWAEVWVDGQPTGETPLGNLEAPIGTREVMFRHPELGERRRTVLVTLLAPARVSVDLTQP